MEFSMTKELGMLIERVAGQHFLDARLVKAMVEVESGGNTFAWRPESGYRYLWDIKLGKPFRKVSGLELTDDMAPSDFPAIAGTNEQEWFAQRASWGLMQVMGAVAREHGYREPYLPGLCAPSIGLLYGCRVLQSHMKWSKGVVDQAVAAYNGGRAGNDKPPYRNAAYIAKVRAAMKV
jgi:hypothetical protein